MPSLLKHPVFIVSTIVYALNKFGLQWLELEDFRISYLNDILCLPIVLTLSLWLQRSIFYSRQNHRLSAIQILFTVGYVALLFEIILPAFSRTYTRDYWDILAYGLGGIIYYFTINPKQVALGSFN